VTDPVPDPTRRVTVTVPAWVASLQDPGIRAAVALGVVAVAGFAMAFFGWRGAARTLYVPLQIPWLLSGGVAGLAVVGTAVAAWSIHLGRRWDAAHRATVEDLVHDVATFVDEVRTRGAR
jgi:hypothetical protein